MGKMLEHLPVAGKYFVEHVFAIVLIAAPEDVIMGAGDNANGIELYHPEVANDLARIHRAGRRFCQPLRREPEVPRGAVADA